ncbi:Hypothetical predicted protein [Mytilus galloprovincialis]|uniref:Ig-like domain-containing protein n=1 Tax=Mytilus galloprovincialis TaxID=29158 RepID=A0A8B6G108_MYTGA|nr:Hypothetical predicted protein [Mytilus galloprovincialis]
MSFEFYFVAGTLAAKVSINQNITGLVGNKDTHLTCFFIKEKSEEFLSVEIIAKNITENFEDGKRPIAIFEPERTAKLHPTGEYLLGRVTLTNITYTSTNATLNFHVLKGTDEKDYMCKYYYKDKLRAFSIAKSKDTRILVKVPVSDVHINSQPNQRQYDSKTDNITLICKASGDPEPKYKWFKENNINTIISGTNRYVIEDVTQNNGGSYICEAYNSINNVNYTQSNSVEIDIADERLLPATKSESLTIFTVHASYVIPVICAVVIVVICFAVRKCSCKREKRNEQDVSVIYSEINKHTQLKYRMTKNQETSLQHTYNVQKDTVDGADKVSRDPTLKYNMITGKLEV